jgi:secreted PhoX family phosphatase
VTTSSRHTEPSDAAAGQLRGKLTSPTRRDFIRGIAAAGASTAGVVAMGGGASHLFADEAQAGMRANGFSDFNAIGASSADAFEVAPGFRADVLISWGDIFRDGDRRALRYGFNNDFLAYFPLRGSREGLLFVNHEYPDPFFLYGYKPTGGPKSAAQVQKEQDAVGNSIVHIRRGRDRRWSVVSPSDYNRRVYGDRPELEFTGPLAGPTGIGATANGSIGNCSGGITPWGTALSCEENFDDYGLEVAAGVTDAYGWAQFGWEPEGRRRFAAAGDTTPLTATEGTGRWVEVPEDALDDTATKLREDYGDDEYDQHFATNRPEDVEVAEDGSVFIALTNNSTVFDSHGSVRRLRERRNDPEASEFRWRDYAAGGPTGSSDPGTQGFSSPDNLVFDKARHLWVVTDISSSRLNQANEYGYHKNNAMFMVPTSGPNKGIAFRFANGPAECEITGPYFTPNERTLFCNVQHPGENTATAAGSGFGLKATYTSWWPDGNKTGGTTRRSRSPRPWPLAGSRTCAATGTDARYRFTRTHLSYSAAAAQAVQISVTCR